MRHRLPTAILCLLLAPPVVRGQTPDIQHEVERTLWYLRALDWVERVTGLPPGVALATLLALVLAVAAALWLWASRRKREE